MWNFKGHLWNFTPDFEPIHHKTCIARSVKNLTSYDILELWHLKSKWDGPQDWSLLHVKHLHMNWQKANAKTVHWFIFLITRSHNTICSLLYVCRVIYDERCNLKTANISICRTGNSTQNFKSDMWAQLISPDNRLLGWANNKQNN